ncbi:non-canonical purine NTP pyrophosphatase [Clostridium sp. ATCC 25772]|uniref:non-canonical purine NTP pyrophosphatase n=1 Tax=Clostridium sp. ATCC 25772 TaxID=1676991 RepID=UPI0009E6D6EB|nr:non-canonical purine NTP pyrophosphatase [Clostridium sp. ATCC 25772]
MMKEIIFVTTNKGKITSAQRELKNMKVLPYNAELIEPRGDDIKEIAKQKVLQAYKIVKKPCIALDSGFFVEALNGFPKAYVNHMLETIGIEGLLKLMDKVENRKCTFKSCLAYYDGTNMEFFESNDHGTLAHSIRENENNEKWSNLWYIFKPKGFLKTLAEFNEEDFLRYDNNSKDDTCIKKFGNWYDTYCK